MSELERLELTIRGRVQGVGFRWSTQAAALRRDLRGWVRNDYDDSVQVVAEGPRAALEEFLAWCRKGPSSARVAAVQVYWTSVGDDISSGFEIRR